MMTDIIAFLMIASVWVIPIILAVTLHEIAHGYVANQLGDDTAKNLGRLSLNPLRHVDKFGTLLLPAILLVVQKYVLGVATPFLVGYAKPVPVNFSKLKRPRKDMILVAAAGPFVNIMLALISGFLMHSTEILPPSPFAFWLQTTLYYSVLINIALAVFNMLPLPPLDGGRIVTGLLPTRFAIPFARIERYGLLIIIFVLVFLPLISEKLGFTVNPLVALLEALIGFVFGIVAVLTGWGT